ncbi:MAG: hypothetical protein ABSC90_16810 [Acidimicrobiales bacterium]|jgi:hypothetical protein
MTTVDVDDVVRSAGPAPVIRAAGPAPVVTEGYVRPSGVLAG